jgi:predicted hydrocarbon binding protein
MQLTQRLILEAMALLDRYPRLSRALLSPIANFPGLSRLLPVLPRAFLGATAFEIHDVDLGQGRIGIGGVDEVIWSSKFLESFHRVLAEKTGSVADKNEALYRVGKEGGYWEVSEALAHGRWAPRPLAALLARPDALQALRRDPAERRFFELAMKMVCRLIINEGGWGAVESLDLGSDPMRVVLGNSNEARWAGPSDAPVCYVSAGVIAGYASRLFNADLDAREVQCAAMGHPRCVFHVHEKVA